MSVVIIGLARVSAKTPGEIYTSWTVRSTRNDVFRLSSTFHSSSHGTFIICTEGQLARVCIFHKHTCERSKKGKKLLSFYSLLSKWGTLSSQSTRDILLFIIFQQFNSFVYVSTYIIPHWYLLIIFNVCINDYKIHGIYIFFI